MVPVVFVVWMVAIAGFDVVAPTGAEPTATAGPMARTAGPEAVAAADPPNATVAGEDVLADQLERVQEVAAANDLSIDEVRRILSDPAAYVAKDDSIFYVEPRPDPPASPADDPAMGDALALSETFKLHTRPGSSRTIFLDFDGHTISGTSWTVDDSGSFTALPFDPDDQPGFAAEDLQAIQQI